MGHGVTKRGSVAALGALAVLTAGCIGPFGHAPEKSYPACGLELGHGHDYHRVDSETGWHSQAMCTEDGVVVPATKPKPKRKPYCDLHTHDHQHDYNSGHDFHYMQGE